MGTAGMVVCNYWRYAIWQPTMKDNWNMQAMGILPDTQNCGLRMRWEFRECFPRHQLQRKPLVSDPDIDHGTCVTHMPWCMSGSLTSSRGENVPSIPGACATCNFTYLARGPWFTSVCNGHVISQRQTPNCMIVYDSIIIEDTNFIKGCWPHFPWLAKPFIVTYTLSMCLFVN